MKLRLKKERTEGKKHFKIDIVEPPLKKIDYVIFFIIAIICFVSFQNSDIVHTAASSIGYLNGHILDFYDYNATYGIYDSYMPSTYILFAIWNIPTYIAGAIAHPSTDEIGFVLLMWNKLLPCIVYMVSGWLLYKIAVEMGMEEKKAKLSAYAFFTMPIGFFSQFIYGQYDIFTVFFVLLGFYFWLKDRDLLFVLFFGIAFTFKYFAFLIFLPLLLLKQKNVLRILAEIIIAFLPFLTEVLIYIQSEGFREYVFDFFATGYVDHSEIVTGVSGISVVLLLFAVIAAYSYFKNITLREERIKWAIYLISLMMFVIFGLCKWNPQWLLLMVPFLTLGAFIHSDTKIFMALDLLLMLFFVIIVADEYAGMADEVLLERGIWGQYIISHEYYKTSLKEILHFEKTDMILSFYATLLLVMAVFKHPSYMPGGFKTPVQKGCMGFIRLRFICGAAMFIIPSAIFFAKEVLPPYITFGTNDQYSDIGAMIDREVTQVFIAQKGKLTSIEFPVGTYERSNNVTLNVSLKDATTMEELFAQDIDMQEYSEDTYIYVDTNDLELVPGNTYRIDISCYNASRDNCVTLYRTEDIGTQRHGFAIIDEVRREYHLCMTIMEDKLD